MLESYWWPIDIRNLRDSKSSRVPEVRKKTGLGKSLGAPGEIGHWTNSEAPGYSEKTNISRRNKTPEHSFVGTRKFGKERDIRKKMDMRKIRGYPEIRKSHDIRTKWHILKNRPHIQNHIHAHIPRPITENLESYYWTCGVILMYTFVVI